MTKQEKPVFDEADVRQSAIVLLGIIFLFFAFIFFVDIFDIGGIKIVPTVILAILGIKLIKRAAKSSIEAKTSNKATFADHPVQQIEETPLPPESTEEPALEDAALAQVMQENPSLYGNDVYHIEYEDSSYRITERDIKINNFEVSGDRLYINAFCYLRNENRQFLVERVVSLSIGNRKIAKPQQFLWDMYQNSPQYLTEKALADHFDEILLLVFLVRADGRMIKSEREIILQYLDAVAANADPVEAEITLKKTYCELAQFNHILNVAKQWSPEVRALLLNAAKKIIAVKKQLDPMEKAAFDKMSSALS